MTYGINNGVITARQLNIVDSDGNRVASIGTDWDGSGGAGLWITGRDGQTACIFSERGQTGIGIYDKGLKDSKGMDLVLDLSDGVPKVQFRHKGGEVQFLNLLDIRAAVSAHQAKQWADDNDH